MSYSKALQRTLDIYNLDDFQPHLADGKYQFPYIQATHHIPKDLISCSRMMVQRREKRDRSKGIHFFEEDYQIEKVWTHARRYIPILAEFDCVCSPDFSMYNNMPLAMKIWNCYRSRLLGQVWQLAGMTVIPTLSWAEEDTFEWCFDGLEEGGVYTVSTVGVARHKENYAGWHKGMDAAIERLHPETILLFGKDIGYDFKDVNVVHYRNHAQDGFNKRKRKIDELFDSMGEDIPEAMGV